MVARYVPRGLRCVLPACHSLCVMLQTDKMRSLSTNGCQLPSTRSLLCAVRLPVAVCDAADMRHTDKMHSLLRNSSLLLSTWRPRDLAVENASTRSSVGVSYCRFRLSSCLRLICVQKSVFATTQNGFVSEALTGVRCVPNSRHGFFHSLSLHASPVQSVQIPCQMKMR